MRRIHIVSIVALIVAIPAATAVAYFSQNGKSAAGKPCFISGNTGYLLSASRQAGHTVRIDNNTLRPDLRMQVVNDPAAADFVVIDDSDATETCKGASVVDIINIDPMAEKPDLTVAISREPAAYKIYLHSQNYTEQDAAALAAVIWQRTSKMGAMRTVSR